MCYSTGPDGAPTEKRPRPGEGEAARAGKGLDVTTVQTWTAQRRQTFGDYGSAPRACWDAWGFGGERWRKHLSRCRLCRATVAEESTRKALDNAREADLDTMRRAGLDP